MPVCTNSICIKFDLTGFESTFGHAKEFSTHFNAVSEGVKIFV